MDEKARLSKADLNKAFTKQLAKREAAPLVTDEAAAAHIAAVVSASASASSLDSFFDAWALYYPKMVSLLGWASWVLPPKAINAIKALLAVINNQIIPLVRDLLK